MKAKELRELTREELTQKLEALRRELFILRQKMKTGKLEKFAQIKQIRKDIARVLTVMKPRFAE
ncbi:MAG: 50S ribosomal protein L29 [Candidatus Omnitrophica bacterium]|nr:50S ribosomal protein L29 [Candidatus Omnitrophota bacterium]